MNGTEPVSKADLAEVKSALKQDLVEVRSALKQDVAEVRSELKQDIGQLRSEMHHKCDDLKETLRDVQTEMLKAFYSFAESNDKRVAQNEVNEIAIRSRVETLERRVTELEKRNNIPPAA